MAANSNDWDYCTIEFQLRYKGEDTTRAGLKVVWLVFQARVSGPNQNYIAGESTEIPVAGTVAGVSFLPQKNNTNHVSIHQDLLHRLQKDGWEQLPKKGGAWWERRLRRRALPQKPALTGSN